MATETTPGQKRETMTRNTDSKGRVSLPKAFANSVVNIEVIDEYEIRIQRVVTVPAREMWLWKNPQALASVQAGIEQFNNGQFVEGPDLEGDLAGCDSEDD
jgi:hypothetical protein